jgi:hypothetical protein
VEYHRYTAHIAVDRVLKGEFTAKSLALSEYPGLTESYAEILRAARAGVAYGRDRRPTWL